MEPQLHCSRLRPVVAESMERRDLDETETMIGARKTAEPSAMSGLEHMSELCTLGH